ncbi:hypothetical protein [Brevundimonas diminuta]|uniref:hypothetical protein n=1 Tax=Brevundimonas diminuta TaxID=293 RepID=UPI0032081FBC
MERRNGLLACLGLALATALSACGAPRNDAATDAPEMREDDWAPTPRILSVSPRPSGGVLVRGVAAPGARVILSGGQGSAVAAAADSQGRFEIQLDAAAGGRLLTPENQVGQVTTPGPQQLLIAGDRQELAALLMEGGPSLRLTPGPALDALDGDGGGLIASGRARPGQTLSIRAGGGAAEVTADRQGRWSVLVPAMADRAGALHVDGQVFDYPGPGGPSDHAERAGEGWRITRQLSSSARQTTWLPDEDAAPPEQTALTRH